MAYPLVLKKQMLELLRKEPVYRCVVRYDAIIKTMPVYGLASKSPF